MLCVNFNSVAEHNIAAGSGSASSRGVPLERQWQRCTAPSRSIRSSRRVNMMATGWINRKTKTFKCNTYTKHMVQGNTSIKLDCDCRGFVEEKNAASLKSKPTSLCHCATRDSGATMQKGPLIFVSLF